MGKGCNCCYEVNFSPPPPFSREITFQNVVGLVHLPISRKRVGVVVFASILDETNPFALESIEVYMARNTKFRLISPVFFIH